MEQTAVGKPERKAPGNNIPAKNRQVRKNKNFLPNGCPVTYCNNILGGKWKPIIVHYIRKGFNRYSMLQREISELSRQALTNQLRELEDDRVIDRKVFAEIPPRVEYSISGFGETLIPIIDLMMEWGTKQLIAEGVYCEETKSVKSVKKPDPVKISPVGKLPGKVKRT